ncbi:unnamed protein product, partial [Ectocarpus sp. 8 AP-2014]
DDGSIDQTIPSSSRPLFSLNEGIGNLRRENNGPANRPADVSFVDSEESMKTSARRQTQRADKLQPRDPTEDVLPEANLGDELVLHEAKFNDDKNTRAILTSGENGSGDTGRNTLDNLRNTFPGTRRAATPPPGYKPWGSSVSYSSSQRHPMDVLERKGFASNTRDTSHGTARGDGASAADAASNITRLTVSLKRAQEEAARERERREVCEEQARAACASLEAESKRACELDNRVRDADILLTRYGHGGRRGDNSGKGAAGGLFGGFSLNSHNRDRKTRSLSPDCNGASRVRAVEAAEETETHMAVIADATEKAREEAQSALDTVEAFAALNRKLVDELRTTVCARDELLGDLKNERGIREQLEHDIEELLGSGLVAEFKLREEELKARCKREQGESARVAKVHARMEEEYRIALDSSDRERARLQETISSLEEKLLSDRREHAISAREFSERATMGSEEMRSLRAGFLTRPRRRGYDRHTVRPSAGKMSGQGGSGGQGDVSGWLADVQQRIDAQKVGAGRDVVRHPTKKTAPDGGRGVGQQNTGSDWNLSSAAVAPPTGGAKRQFTQPSSGGSGGGGGGGGDGSSIEFGGTGSGDGSAGQAVHAAAVENVELFLGDFVPEVRAQPPPGSALLSTSANASGSVGEGKVGGEEHHGSAVVKKASKWAAIGRGGKISARAAAVCLEEANKAAQAETLHRLRSMINAAARTLSASWFSLLATATSAAATHGGHAGHGTGGGRGEGTADENINSAADRPASTDATVPAIAVRRLVQSCGILRNAGGGPTLAHADMELQRNTASRGGRSVDHREYFKIIMALSQYRFAGDAKDHALEQLSRMLRPVQPDSPRTPPHAQSRQPAPRSAKLSAGDAAIANSVSTKGAGLKEGLDGAERVLERDRRALEAMFLHYSTCGLLPFSALAAFCKDFELTPGLIPRDSAHRIYVQLAYPNEPALTPKLLAAREGPQGQRSAAAVATAAQNQFGEGGVVAAAGLGLDQWMAWLGLVAVGCSWFDKQRGLYNTPTKKVLGLLQWMEGSVGKKRISAKRGGTFVPAFNLLPLKVDHRQRA